MKWLETNKTRFVYVGRMFKILWQNDKPFIFVIIGGLILASAVPFTGMYLTKYSIDMLTQGEAYTKYLFVVGILLLITVIITLLMFVLSVHCDIMGIMIGQKLFRNIFNKSMELDYDMLLDKHIQEKRELAMKVIDQGRFNVMICNFRFFVTNSIIIAGIIYIVSSIEWWILLIVLAIVIINSVSSFTRKEAERVINVEMAPATRKIGYFWNINTDTAMGKEIRTYTMQRSLNAIYKDLHTVVHNSIKKIHYLYWTAGNINHVTTLCLNVVIYFYLGYKILVTHSITIGDFSLYLSAVGTFNRAIQDMVASYIDISNSGAYLKDYFDYMGLKSRFDIGGAHVPVTSNSDCTFVFENIGFKYPYQETFSLKGINLTLTNKERLAIVGENGAGKTTLIKLLLRLYDPTEGRILLNGVDIKEIDYSDYLKLFSTVFQDFKIFAFRIADNITALSDGADRTRKGQNRPSRKRDSTKKLPPLKREWTPISISSTRRTA
ncbi:hypothetical protein FACS1894142_7740 [Spirochaetia bacterium]|nr:hypothetical protein FACS1894142_7740 [Spirochaetia bacterium]